MLTALNGWRTPDEFPAAGRWEDVRQEEGDFSHRELQIAESSMSLTRPANGDGEGYPSCSPDDH